MYDNIMQHVINITNFYTVQQHEKHPHWEPLLDLMVVTLVRHLLENIRHCIQTCRQVNVSKYIFSTYTLYSKVTVINESATAMLEVCFKQNFICKI